MRMREVALVDGDTHEVAGVDEEQGLTDRHIAERADVTHRKRFVADLDAYGLSESIPELTEPIRLDVRNQVAKLAIESDDMAGNAARIDRRG